MKIKWPDSYLRGEGNIWLSCPSTSNILDVAAEKKRLANAFPESKIEIKHIAIDNATKYYFIRMELTDEDEPVFIIQETK
jgi:hypothetical protein